MINTSELLEKYPDLIEFDKKFIMEVFSLEKEFHKMVADLLVKDTKADVEKKNFFINGFSKIKSSIIFDLVNVINENFEDVKEVDKISSFIKRFVNQFDNQVFEIVYEKAGKNDIDFLRSIHLFNDFRLFSLKTSLVDFYKIEKLKSAKFNQISKIYTSLNEEQIKDKKFKIEKILENIFEISNSPQYSNFFKEDEKTKLTFSELTLKRTEDISILEKAIKNQKLIDQFDAKEVVSRNYLFGPIFFIFMEGVKNKLMKEKEIFNQEIEKKFEDFLGLKKIIKNNPTTSKISDNKNIDELFLGALSFLNEKKIDKKDKLLISDKESKKRYINSFLDYFSDWTIFGFSHQELMKFNELSNNFSHTRSRILNNLNISLVNYLLENRAELKKGKEYFLKIFSVFLNGFEGELFKDFFDGKIEKKFIVNYIFEGALFKMKHFKEKDLKEKFFEEYFSFLEKHYSKDEQEEIFKNFIVNSRSVYKNKEVMDIAFSNLFEKFDIKETKWKDSFSFNFLKGLDNNEIGHASKLSYSKHVIADFIENFILLSKKEKTFHFIAPFFRIFCGGRKEFFINANSPFTSNSDYSLQNIGDAFYHLSNVSYNCFPQISSKRDDEYFAVLKNHKDISFISNTEEDKVPFEKYNRPSLRQAFYVWKKNKEEQEINFNMSTTQKAMASVVWAFKDILMYSRLGISFNKNQNPFDRIFDSVAKHSQKGTFEDINEKDKTNIAIHSASLFSDIFSLEGGFEWDKKKEQYFYNPLIPGNLITNVMFEIKNNSSVESILVSRSTNRGFLNSGVISNRNGSDNSAIKYNKILEHPGLKSKKYNDKNEASALIIDLFESLNYFAPKNDRFYLTENANLPMAHDSRILGLEEDKKSEYVSKIVTKINNFINNKEYLNNFLEKYALKMSTQKNVDRIPKAKIEKKKVIHNKAGRF